MLVSKRNFGGAYKLIGATFRLIGNFRGGVGGGLGWPKLGNFRKWAAKPKFVPLHPNMITAKYFRSPTIIKTCRREAETKSKITLI